MEISLAPEAKKIIEGYLGAGEYASAEDVVTAALHLLRNNKDSGDFAPGELDQLVAEGEASGEPLPGEQVLAELRQLRESYR